MLPELLALKSNKAVKVRTPDVLADWNILISRLANDWGRAIACPRDDAARRLR